MTVRALPPASVERNGDRMQKRTPPARDDGWTRSALFRRAAASGAVVAGGAWFGARSGDSTSLAAPTPDTDAKILNFFLLLEQVQEAFYRQALSRTRPTGELGEFARAVLGQESDHVAFLTKRLGSRARKPPEPDFGDAVSTPERFQAAAIDLEETTIAAYIGQGANLTRAAVGTVGTQLSVEARQAAWVLDLAGKSPAPNAADPARKPGDVLAHLRRQGYIT
jgi:hypothetical protein